MPAPAAQLPIMPRSRSFERARPWRVWGAALAIACCANALVVVVLAHMSRLQALPAPEALVAHALRELPPPPPPPVPPSQEEPPPEQPQSPPALAVTLPSLELARAPSDDRLALPDMGALDAPLALPMTMPDFTTSEAAGSGQPLLAGPPAFDTPAEREGAFDLDRFYPRIARVRLITGTTRVRISISASGLVEQVQVLESTPHEVFDEAAVRLVKTLRYRPALAANHPVASVQDTLISWTIK
jgi:protein TonB